MLGGVVDRWWWWSDGVGGNYFFFLPSEREFSLYENHTLSWLRKSVIPQQWEVLSYTRLNGLADSILKNDFLGRILEWRICLRTTVARIGRAPLRLQALVYDILPSTLEEDAGKRCSECDGIRDACSIFVVWLWANARTYMHYNNKDLSRLR